MPYAPLVTDGTSQAVRLPKAFRLPGDKVRITRQGNGLLIEPLTEDFSDFFEAARAFSPDFMADGREQTVAQERAWPFA
jgi:antitoxin VapB